jgi:Trk K+ transport system NAD-binding subunit
VITTVGFGDIALLGASPPVKVFGMFTMLAGVALLVVGFGVLTDYLVSHRVEQAMGRPRTTLRNHVIVVGLGNIGHRVALDLHAVGHTVLAVDQRADLRFTSMLPEDVPVMFGDATDPHTLHLAGADDARAIVAVTDNDVVNLRVAHTAKGMNPDVRTVIRLFSHRLADRLGTRTLGVDLALNPSVAAGATFAAAALEDGVLQGIWYGRRLLMLRRVSCVGLPHLVGHSTREVRGKGMAMPLLRRAGPGQTMSVAALDDVLGADDELIVLEEYRDGSRTCPRCELESSPGQDGTPAIAPHRTRNASGTGGCGWR